MKVLICGGGVIGAAAAYFLARRGAAVTLIERTGVGCAASGRSGGFLALDWCDGTALAPLARRSFALHADLAAALPEDWGYRRMDSFAGVSGEALRGAGGGPPGWLSDRVAIRQRLGSPDTTAQIDPARFTGALVRAAEREGATLRLGRVTGLLRDTGGTRVAGVLVDGEAVTGDAVVIAMGPWSIEAAAWAPLPAVHGLKGHSIVWATGDAVPAEAVFLEHLDPAGGASPEIFPRPDGTTYVCGISSDSALPGDPAGVAPDPGAIARLEAMAAAIVPVLGTSPVLARQACFRPVTRDGLPLIGAVAGLEGGFIATGHSVWGMLNAPATGEALAELILDGRSTLDLAAFRPGRLPAHGRAGALG
jgi:glycine/D-amino acid oxidase-like deaminating enzyme